MSRIDYSVPNLSVTVGSFDLTPHLAELEIHLPISEITQPLTWKGSFKVAFCRAAIDEGLVEDDFDEFATPSRWRTGQQVVTITVNGYVLPKLRIERYAYDLVSNTGEGTLYQILDVVDHDRPATSANVPVRPTSLSEVVRLLMVAAFLRSRVIPTMLLGAQDWEMLGGLTTRQPLRDAQQILGVQWQWLTVDNLERVVAISGIPGSPLLSRTATQCELKRETNQIAFPSKTVYVTGSRQSSLSLLSGSARPKFQTTQEFLPFNQVFENGGGTTTTQTLAETKRIAYLYPGDRQLDFTTAADLPGTLLTNVNAATPIAGADPNKAYLTVTIKKWPAGRIFKSLGTNTSLNIAEITVQTETYRDVWVPFGTLDVTGASTSFTPARLRKEDLLSSPVGLNITFGTNSAGSPILLEPGQLPEEQPPAPEIPSYTEPIFGKASVVPAGWVPLIERNSVFEVGFLPSFNIADALARRLALREQYRRNTITGKMPIPTEWLAAGCPVLPVFSLVDGDFLIEGIALVFQPNECYMGFTGNRMTYNGSPVVTEVIEIEINTTASIDVTASPGSLRVTTLTGTAYTQG